MYQPMEDAEELLHQTEQPTSRRWMIMLADLLSLILTFFVMIYAMSEIPTAAWREVVVSMQSRLNPDRPIEQLIFSNTSPTYTEPVQPATDLDYLMQILSNKLQSTDKIPLSIAREPDKIVISLPGDLYFIPGSDALNEERTSTMRQLAQLIRPTRNRIQIEGHTDPRPYSGNAFSSNWELALARANTIANLLQQFGYGGSIRRVGRGASVFHEISQDLPRQERYKLARRVEIIIRADQ